MSALVASPISSITSLSASLMCDLNFSSSSSPRVLSFSMNLSASSLLSFPFSCSFPISSSTRSFNNNAPPKPVYNISLIMGDSFFVYYRLFLFVLIGLFCLFINLCFFKDGLNHVTKYQIVHGDKDEPINSAP